MRTPKPPSDGWLRRSMAQASSRRSRPGKTSLCCGGPGQASSTRSGGVRPANVSQATRRGGNGLRLRQRIQASAVCSGCAIRTGLKHVRYLSQGRLRTSSGRSPRRHGRRPSNAPEAGSPRRSTGCRRARNRMRRFLGGPRGLPRTLPVCLQYRQILVRVLRSLSKHGNDCIGAHARVSATWLDLS